MTRPTEAPSCMTSLDEAAQVAAVETWQNGCPACHRTGRPSVIQGGRAGMAAHYATVHADVVEEEVLPRND